MQTAAALFPMTIVQVNDLAVPDTAFSVGGGAVESSVNTVPVVISAKQQQFPLSITSGPERYLIGSIRRECPDRMIILGERNLKRILSSYVDYYYKERAHLSLEKDAPEGRVGQLIKKGRVIELKRVGRLHHLYARMAA